jgi:hypothetical protein
MTAPPDQDPFAAWQGRAARMLRHFAEQQAIAEAEAAMRGEHPVSITHGDPETDLDVSLVTAVLPALAARAGQEHGAWLVRTLGGSDYTTRVFGGAGAAAAAAAYAAWAADTARAHARGWWRISMSLYPPAPRW